MSWRDPRRALERQPSPSAEEEPTAVAELHVVLIPASVGDQVSPDLKPPNRIAALLRRSGIGAALRLAVPPSEASQMLAVVERTANSLIWAITMIATLTIAVAWHLSATVTIVTIAFELAGLITILLATRRRRRRPER